MLSSFSLTTTVLAQGAGGGGGLPMEGVRESLTKLEQLRDGGSTARDELDTRRWNPHRISEIQIPVWSPNRKSPAPHLSPLLHSISRFAAMARKAYIPGEEKDRWTDIRLWTLRHGYSPPKPAPAVPDGTLVVLTHFKIPLSSHILLDLAPHLEDIVSGPDPPPLVVVMDLSRLAVSAAKMGMLLDSEGSTQEGRKPGVCKPVTRMLEKLHLQNATCVAFGRVCPVLLKILMQEKRKVPGITRVVLVHPLLTRKTVQGLLDGAPRVGGVEVDVLFSSKTQRNRHLKVLRSVFGEGWDGVCKMKRADEKSACSRLPAALQRWTHWDTSASAAFALDRMDCEGRTLWVGQLKVETNPITKQY